MRFLLLMGICLALLLVGGLWVAQKLPGRRQPPTMVSKPATQPATRPMSTPVAAAPRSYVELLRTHYAMLPTTRPLDQPLEARYAGHFTLSEPVYLDFTRRLWITRPDAPADDLVLAKAPDQQIILTRRRPLYVHWTFNDGPEQPHLICRAPGGGYELIDANGRQRIGDGRRYDWPRARYWDDKLVVPTDVGVSIFTMGNRIAESVSPPLAEPGVEHAPVQIVFSTGPLAWIPPRKDHPGSQGAVRYVENAWSSLKPEAGWPAGLLHLIPLLDGSVLQLIGRDDGPAKINVVPLDPMPQEESKRATELIVTLSDPDPAKRQKAFEELTRYGPGLWPIAEKMIATEPAETRVRLRELLRARVSPLLGRMQLVDGRLQVAQRYADGGVLFYVKRGVTIPQNEDEPPMLVAPAWLTALPGDSIRLVPPELVRDLDPAKVRLTPSNGEWIVTDEVFGPRQFIGGELVKILRKDEMQFSQFVGISRGARLVLATPADGPSTQATTRPSTQPATQTAEPATLIIDPTMPDAKPRLPVWQLVYDNNGEVGWDKNDWPAAKQKNAWALGETEWRSIDEKAEPFYTKAEQVPLGPAFTSGPATQRAATRPAATQASVTQPASTQPDAAPILVDSAGTFYFDGRQTLTTITRDGQRTVWTLPALACGSGEVHLVRTKAGLLFLFNQPGRVVRIRPTPGGPEPLALDAIFTRNVPNIEHPTRIWLDPFGRIDMAFDGNKLAIMFPQGYVPPEIANLVRIADSEDE